MNLPATASESPAPPAIRWEAHACLPLLANQDMSALLRYRQAGFHHVSVNVGMDMTPLDTVMRVIAGFRSWVSRHGDALVLAHTLADIRSARDQGKLAISFDLEGSSMLLEDPAMVELFAALGVRQILLAYNRDNACAGGCHGADIGLSRVGREVVAAIHKAGVVMDCSHAGKRSSLEIIECSNRPVVFSHTNVKALFDHPRTIDDEQILACAGSGGVIGLTGLGLFLGDPRASARSFVRQIDYLAALVGTAHIGLGLDTELTRGAIDLPVGVSEEAWWPDVFYGGISGQDQLQPEALPDIARELERLGYKNAEINAIFGENFVRVAEATWLP
ncbi:membrane dipeptidase [Pseudomonas rhodesiae]|uniref:membrane dipeptidase n=1 Tax=Pseudomonas rhodesiae TaxID=76760 RepID=UPI002736A770|nr:membrane dipeptidase [Pseudomonas rhodesiae]WLG41963.1 membrane dipeptidase [Pseudomonas rhodesiae]